MNLSASIPLPFCAPVHESQCDCDQAVTQDYVQKEKAQSIGKQDFATALLQHIMAGDKGKIFRRNKS